MGTERRIFRSKAPTRIDLAGGTLDIWPIYLFLRDALTVNLGIDLFAEATLEENPAGLDGILLRSEDQGAELRLKWADLPTASAPPQLELHLKLLRWFARDGKPSGGLSLSTRARSPAGAGLGGSSTLSIAMIGALASWREGHALKFTRPEGDRFIEIVRDVETTVIQVPAGMQDYYGAMYGGLQTLSWQPGVHGREALPAATLQDLEKRLLLYYSGQSRNSGINNWLLFKNFVDRDADVRARFEKINEATHALRAALFARDWAGVTRAIAAEWSVRRQLAAGITTPEIDRAFELAGQAARGAGKICGAGGGGCFFYYCEDPTQRARVSQALAEVPGLRPLPFQAVPHGLQVEMETPGSGRA